MNVRPCFDTCSDFTQITIMFQFYFIFILISIRVVRGSWGQISRFRNQIKFNSAHFHFLVTYTENITVYQFFFLKVEQIKTRVDWVFQVRRKIVLFTNKTFSFLFINQFIFQNFILDIELVLCLDFFLIKNTTFCCY